MTEPSTFDGGGGGPDQVVHNGRPVLWAPNPGPQTLLLTCPLPDAFFGGSRGGGKGIRKSLENKILTPFGFKPVADVKLGDAVCAVDGTVTKIIGVYEQGVRPIYRCHFSDGSTVEVDDQHIWQGWRVNQTIKKGNVKTSGADAVRNYSMQELLEFVGVERERATYATNRLAVPVPQPVAYNVHGQFQKIPGQAGRAGTFVTRAGLHPYVLGVLLGDGCITDRKSILFCSADPEIPERVRGLLGPDDTLRGPYSSTRTAKTWKITSASATFTLDMFGLNGKYAWEKSIPRIYKMGSVEERWELLRGLMDTDGWVDADGDIYFTSTSQKLAEDVREIAWSLGGIVTWREKVPTFTYLEERKEGRRAYTVRLKFRDNGLAFALSRKKDIASGKKYQNFCRYMERIERIADDESVCFQVAHPSSLFITNDFIVTHNTWGLLGAWLQHSSRWGGKARGIFFRKTYRQMDEVIERSRRIYASTGATYASSEYTWRWPSGASLRFRYLDKDSDAEEYQGHEFNFMAYDEITNWPSPRPIDKLMACLRSSEGVSCIRRSSGNPGGPGTKWVRDRYIKDRTPGEPFDVIPNPARPDLKTRAVFIPSKLEDNPKLHVDDPTYETRLALATFGDDALWKAWREGDWDVLVGRYFERFTEADNVYDPRTVELSPWMPKWISVDWGYEHPSAVYWYTWDGTNIWVHREFVRAKLTPVQLAYEIAGMTFGETVDAVYLSPDAFGRKMSERTIAQEMADVFRTFNIPEPAQADHDRVGGAMLLQQMFGERRLMISRDCPKLIECIPLCQRDTSDGGNPEDVDKFDGDDAYDSLRYGVKTRPGSVRVPDEILIARRVTASDPQSRFMQTRVAQADLRNKSAAIVAMRRSGNWRREMAAN